MTLRVYHGWPLTPVLLRDFHAHTQTRRGILGRNTPVMRADGAVCNRQAQPHAARLAVSGTVHPEKRLKDPGQHLFRHSGTVIAHRNRSLHGGCFQPDIDCGAFRRVANGSESFPAAASRPTSIAEPTGA